MAGRTRRAIGDAEFEANATAGESLMQNLAIEEALRVADLIAESNAPMLDGTSGAADSRLPSRR